MKKQLALLFFLLVSTHGFGQELTLAQKDSIKTVLDSMLLEDQKYRDQLGVFSKEKLDSIRKLSGTLENGIKVIYGEEWGFDRQRSDSLWKYIRKTDSLNMKTLLMIIKKYGFPSDSRVGTIAADKLVIQMIKYKDFPVLLPIFKKELKKGNMHPKSYAAWYDRCQIFMLKKQLYGEYVKEYICVESLRKTNKKRKKIGLDEFPKDTQNRCREEKIIKIN